MSTIKVTEGGFTRDRGGWRLQYRIDQAPVVERGRTKDECRAKRKTRVAALEAESHISETMSLTQLRDRYLSVNAGLAPSTKHGISYGVALLTDALGDVPVAGLRLVDVEVAFAEAATELRTSTLSARRKSLSMIFKWAQAREMMTVNPLLGLDLSKLGAGESKDRSWLGQEQTMMLSTYLARTPSEMHTALMLSLWAGLRIGEAVALRWEDVDLYPEGEDAVPTVTVAQQWNGTAITRKLKTKSAGRTIDIPSVLVDYLRDWQRYVPAGARLVTVARVTEDRPSLDQPLSVRGVGWALDQAIVDLGIKRINLHGLRHTAGSIRLAANGHDLSGVAAFLGHSDLQMVVRVYGHATRSSGDAKLVDAMFAGAVAS
jgi:integrase